MATAWAETRGHAADRAAADSLAAAGRTWVEVALAQVNTRFNAYAQVPDQALWGRREYWATPAETSARGAGDCEDLAIAKYFALLEHGTAEDRLRLVVARLWLPHRRAIEDHMVLAYYPAPGGDPLILDNVERRILPLSRRQDLVAVAGFNRMGWWSVGPGVEQFRGPVVPYADWHDMLARHRGQIPLATSARAVAAVRTGAGLD
ncbi:MAG: transglutaminase-like cysteine peptidase [Aquabacterium sp.]